MNSAMRLDQDRLVALESIELRVELVEALRDRRLAAIRAFRRQEGGERRGHDTANLESPSWSRVRPGVCRGRARDRR